MAPTPAPTYDAILEVRVAPPGLATSVEPDPPSPVSQLELQRWGRAVPGVLVRHAVLCGVVGLAAGAALAHPAVGVGLAGLVVVPTEHRDGWLDAASSGWSEAATWALALGAAGAVAYASAGPPWADLAWAALALCGWRTLLLGVALAHVALVRVRVTSGRREAVLFGRHLVTGPVAVAAPKAAGVIAGAIGVLAALGAWATGLVPAHLDGAVAALLVASALTTLRGALGKAARVG